MTLDPASGVWEERATRWLSRPLLQLTTAAILFTPLAALSASQLYVNWIAAGLEVSYWRLFAVRLADWWLWALAVPMVVALDGLLRARRHHWYFVVVMHLSVATAWFAAQNALLVSFAPIADAQATGRPFLEAWLERGLVRLSSAWMVYGAILIVVALLRDFVRRQNLLRDLYDAQLRALRAQIQPHFLFNTLHTVGALVRSGDRDRAIGTLVSLSDLLRRSLSHARRDEVSLEEELEFLDAYVDIQRARFGDRLAVLREIAPGASGARVPSLVLQPLVENAIRHGLDLDREPGTVRILIAPDDGRLRIRVEDDGGMLAEEPPEAEAGDDGGIGLSNLRDRLLRLYGPEQSLLLAPTDSGVTAVTITIPLRRP